MIKLYYQYSKLDGQHQFGIVSVNRASSIYLWVFFYLGWLMKSEGIIMDEDLGIFAHSLGEENLIKEYVPADSLIIAGQIFQEIKDKIG